MTSESVGPQGLLDLYGARPRKARKLKAPAGPAERFVCYKRDRCDTCRESPARKQVLHARLLEVASPCDERRLLSLRKPKSSSTDAQSCRPERAAVYTRAWAFEPNLSQASEASRGLKAPHPPHASLPARLITGFATRMAGMGMASPTKEARAGTKRRCGFRRRPQLSVRATERLSATGQMQQALAPRSTHFHSHARRAL